MIVPSTVGKLSLAFALACGLILVVAAPSSASQLLYEQVDPPTVQSFSSTDFGPPNDELDSQGADDFVLPAGGPWTIESVDVLGSGGGGSEELSASVWIYSSTMGQLDSQLLTQSGIPLSGNNNFTVPVSKAPALEPGAYWLSVQLKTNADWLWETSATAHGSLARWQNPGNGRGTGCTFYMPISACGATSATSFQFRLFGSAPPPVEEKHLSHMHILPPEPLPCSLGKVKKKRNGSAVLPMTCSKAGRITVEGKGRSKSLIERRAMKGVAGATVKLPILPTPKAKDRLAAGKKVEVEVTVRVKFPGGTEENGTIRTKLRAERRRHPARSV